MDDVLDFIGDASQVGKPVANDLRQGIVTLPVIDYLDAHPHDKRVDDLLRSGQHGDELVLPIVGDVQRFRRSRSGGAVPRAITCARRSRRLLQLPDSEARQSMLRRGGLCGGARLLKTTDHRPPTTVVSAWMSTRERRPTGRFLFRLNDHDRSLNRDSQLECARSARSVSGLPPLRSLRAWRSSSWTMRRTMTASAMVREKYPQVALIANAVNRGFTGGNNQGIAVAARALRDGAESRYGSVR